MTGKCIIFSAPSGAGKTTIVKHLLTVFSSLQFSVSAASRPSRGGETNGKDYYFLSPEEFKSKIEAGEFLEWEEVYPNQFYGTLRSEIKRIWDSGCCVIFDVDVVGGIHLKEIFKEKALAVFVQPPSLDILSKRLKGRGTENNESLSKRINKAKSELDYAQKFDHILVNDNLSETLKEAESLVGNFLRK